MCTPHLGATSRSSLPLPASAGARSRGIPWLEDASPQVSARCHLPCSVCATWPSSYGDASHQPGPHRTHPPPSGRDHVPKHGPCHGSPSLGRGLMGGRSPARTNTRPSADPRERPGGGWVGRWKVHGGRGGGGGLRLLTTGPAPSCCPNARHGRSIPGFPLVPEERLLRLSPLSWTRESGPPPLRVSSAGEAGREQTVRQVMGRRAKEAACTWVRVLGAEHTGPVWGAHPLPTSLALSRCPTPTPVALRCFLPPTAAAHAGTSLASCWSCGISRGKALQGSAQGKAPPRSPPLPGPWVPPRAAAWARREAQDG